MWRELGRNVHRHQRGELWVIVIFVVTLAVNKCTVLSIKYCICVLLVPNLDIYKAIMFLQ